MRRALVLLLLIFTVSTPALAQSGWNLTSLSLGSGEDPITSGIGITADFARNKNAQMFEVAFQNEQAWLGYGPKFNTGQVAGHLIGSIGHFQGAPWAGPRLVVNTPIVEHASLGLIAWPGFFAWKPASFKTHMVSQPMIGHYYGASLSRGPVSLSYTLQKFLDNAWNELPGWSYNANVGQGFSATASGTYNKNDDRWMFYVGASWAPPAFLSGQTAAK